MFYKSLTIYICWPHEFSGRWHSKLQKIGWQALQKVKLIYSEFARVEFNEIWRPVSQLREYFSQNTTRWQALQLREHLSQALHLREHLVQVLHLREHFCKLRNVSKPYTHVKIFCRPHIYVNIFCRPDTYVNIFCRPYTPHNYVNFLCRPYNYVNVFRKLT